MCRAYNPKKYPVKWYKDGVEITFNDRISTKEAEGSLFLIIKALEMEDEGVYSCRIGAHETKGKLGVVHFPHETGFFRCCPYWTTLMYFVGYRV